VLTGDDFSLRTRRNAACHQVCIENSSGLSRVAVP
jgi:hypothetical protein